jgi:hypothetical protein
MKAIEIESGARFWKWTVIARGENSAWGQVRFECKCECGVLRLVWSSSLRSGGSQGCSSCARKQRNPGWLGRTHGMSYSSVYRVWDSMIRRCKNPTHKKFLHYGGRGIVVCERWRSFANFYADMGDPPRGLTLERIDNDLGYWLENCKWATYSEQNSNRRPYKKRKRGLNRDGLVAVV